MPLPEKVRYRMKRTPHGMVRLAFKVGTNQVVEAKNMTTGKIHSYTEFMKERKRRRKHEV
jgi:hypothetical protein